MAGQAAGSTGLAVSCWQWLGSVFIVIIAMPLLPGITCMELTSCRASRCWWAGC